MQKVGHGGGLWRSWPNGNSALELIPFWVHRCVWRLRLNIKVREATTRSVAFQSGLTGNWRIIYRRLDTKRPICHVSSGHHPSSLRDSLFFSLSLSLSFLFFHSKRLSIYLGIFVTRWLFFFSFFFLSLCFSFSYIYIFFILFFIFALSLVFYTYSIFIISLYRFVSMSMFFLVISFDEQRLMNEKEMDMSTANWLTGRWPV